MSNSSPGGPVSSTQASAAISIVSEHIGGLSPHPFLPFEIWDMILLMIWDEFRNCTSQEDLIHLWTSVRPVCKQLKATVEDSFKTQHLPKTVLHFTTDTYYANCDTFSRSRADIWATWVRAPLDQVERYDFKIQLGFAELVEKEPGRAVFNVQHKPNDPNDPENVYESVIFRHMREKGGLGPMGDADKYMPSERRRLFGESEGWGPPSRPIPIFEPVTTEGMFVIQVRAGLNDCAVPGLKIDQEEREISFDWTGLFSRFFCERKAMNLHEGIVSHLSTLHPSPEVFTANAIKDGGLEYPWPPAKQCPLYDGASPLHGNPLQGNLDPTLVDLATKDYRQLCELSNESKKSIQLIDRLRDPVRTWRNDMGRFVGRERLSIGSLRLKRNCDLEVTLDDEGDIDDARADEEALRMRGKTNGWMWAGRVGAARISYRYCEANSASQLWTCDACRLGDERCVRRWSFDSQGYVSGCSFCFKNNKRCKYQMAELNNDWLSPPPASTSLASQAFPIHGADGLNALPLQPALEPMRITRGQQVTGQNQCPNYSPIARHSLLSVPDWDPMNPMAAASSRIGEPCYPPGNFPYSPSYMPSHARRPLSQQILVESIVPIMEHNLCAEAKTSKEAEENTPACVGEPHSFFQIDAVEDCGLPNTKTPRKDIMRQVIASRGFGNLIVALVRRNERGEFGLTSSHHGREGVNTQVAQSRFRRQQSPVSQRPYTEGSQKWRAKQPTNKDQPFPARPDTHIDLHENSIEEPHEQEQPALLQVRGSASRHRTRINRMA
ncbi:MAG: hypothetical protein Q9175_006243 [Cornicularia normoerica]